MWIITEQSFKWNVWFPSHLTTAIRDNESFFLVSVHNSQYRLHFSFVPLWRNCDTCQNITLNVSISELLQMIQFFWISNHNYHRLEFELIIAVKSDLLWILRKINCNSGGRSSRHCSVNVLVSFFDEAIENSICCSSLVAFFIISVVFKIPPLVKGISRWMNE